MKTFKVKIKLKKEIAENTLMLELEKPIGFNFQAGQFIMIIIPQLDSNVLGGNERAMSIASPPYFENLQIVFRKSESAFKKAWEELVTGDEIEIKGPCGVFTLLEIEKEKKEEIIFLIGGVGITPARSILLEIINKKITKKIFLFYSNTKPETAVFLEEFKNINNFNFKFIPTMTRMEESTKSWEGEKGRIDANMLKRYILDINNSVYCIVGPIGFVQEIKDMLKELGVKNKKIKFENF